MPRRVQRSRSAFDGAPVLVFDRAGAREVDRLAVSKYGIPSIVLMENAAIGAANSVHARAAEFRRTSIDVLCGPGNNGGDGLAMARHLSNRGFEVQLVLCAPATACAEDALTNLRIVRSMKLPVKALAGWRWSGRARSLIVVDAVLGTGVRGPVSGRLARAIAAINAAGDAGAFICAVDVPSGLDADSGRGLVEGAAPGYRAVRADETVAMCGPKQGCLTPEGMEYTGACMVVDIGAPRELVERHALGPVRARAVNPPSRVRRTL